MKLKQIKNELTSQTYDFLRTDVHLNHNIVIPTLGGNHAYGTSTENSDCKLTGNIRIEKGDFYGTKTCHYN